MLIGYDIIWLGNAPDVWTDDCVTFKCLEIVPKKTTDLWRSIVLFLISLQMSFDFSEMLHKQAVCLLYFVKIHLHMLFHLTQMLQFNWSEMYKPMTFSCWLSKTE